jgi:hypothetical protein
VVKTLARGTVGKADEICGTKRTTSEFRYGHSFEQKKSARAGFELFN